MIINTSPAEGFPNTFLQAWSRGIPSVSFFDAGVRSAGSEVGWAVPDLETMVDAVLRLKTDERLWRARGESAAQHVRRHHSLALVVDSYEGLFDSMLASGHREARA